MSQMQGRPERAMAVPGQGVPPAASPLKREIIDLKLALDIQSKAIACLREKLAPVYQNAVAEAQAACDPACDPPMPSLSEVPTGVRDCRYHLLRNTTELEWLLERLEV